ncbi:PREDICTED: ubiquitin domain-containing protein 1-like isoform X1 [Rhagoletis zephyria]|uniref:ubiquitin domain-containing protein 1-like isoform X1 n=2 Tax=Rhagoletis zephyria TaxID=28612 RepID=UPI0008115B92|nr:PREDICTED: ubiquitin domain-containing protein 1-like isoform X1 [Rhagoletis zephyria]
MGGCIGIHSNDNETVSVSSASVSRPTTAAGGGQMGPSRKNRPLCNETIRWRSDVPLTEGQLRSKRDEFWDTAPAFDGRKEIWDALRAATNAAEELNFELAQAILDGANISVPNGSRSFQLCRPDCRLKLFALLFIFNCLNRQLLSTPT